MRSKASTSLKDVCLNINITATCHNIRKFNIVNFHTFNRSFVCFLIISYYSFYQTHLFQLSHNTLTLSLITLVCWRILTFGILTHQFTKLIVACEQSDTIIKSTNYDIVFINTVRYRNNRLAYSIISPVVSINTIQYFFIKEH